MELNPFEARMRILEHRDEVQSQREATPDSETAGCPGCPYFWTCEVPHRSTEEVAVPREIDLDDDEVTEQTTLRQSYREYTPRDESDIGWTDIWIPDSD